MSDLNDFIPTSDTVVVEIKHPNTGKTLDNDDGSPMKAPIEVQVKSKDEMGM